MKIHGNGRVVIGSNCDLGPDVSFITGSHSIGSHARRAGDGYNADIQVGNGCWICAGASIMPGVQIGEGCVVASYACVTILFFFMLTHVNIDVPSTAVIIIQIVGILYSLGGFGGSTK